MTTLTRMWTGGLDELSATSTHPTGDPRGLVVVDPHRHRVGEVDGLIVDIDERRTRLLVVGTAGLVGFDHAWRLIPVEAVTHIDDQVHINASHEHVHRCAPYQPGAGSASPSTYDAVYDHYGYPPLWRILGD